MKFRLNNIGLQNKLIVLYIIGIIIPFAIVGVFLSLKLVTLTKQNNENSSEAYLSLIKNNIVYKFEDYERVIQSLLTNKTMLQYINTDFENEHESIQAFKESIAPIIRNNSIITQDLEFRVFSDNKSIYFSKEMNCSFNDLAEQNWYYPDKTEKDGLHYWKYTTELIGALPSRYIGCYQKLTSSDQKYTVIAFFFEENLLRQYLADEPKNDKILLLMDEWGNVVTSTHSDWIFKNIEELGLSSYDISSAGMHSKRKVSGDSYYISSMNISQPNLYMKDWYVVELIPSEQFTSSVRSILLSSVLLWLICMAACLTLVMWFSQNLCRRIQKFNQNISYAMQNNYSASEIIITGTDEIGKIEKTFQEMVLQTNSLINEVYLTNINYQKLEVEKRNAEIIALREQINPHYLFNTLESIRMNLILNGDRRNAKIVSLFAESFRASLETPSEDHTVEHELNLVHKYFLIQQYRTRGRVILTDEVPNELLSCKIPKLLLQPLVENAIYHGIEPTGRVGTVVIKGCITDGTLKLQVIDDGLGMDEETLEQVRSLLENTEVTSSPTGDRIALRNVHVRLKLKYGEEYGIQVDSLEGTSTCVTILLPAESI